MKKALIRLMLSCGFISGAYATESLIVTNSVHKTASAKISTVVGYSLMTDAGLDSSWQNRDKLTSEDQATLANYYLTSPKIPSSYSIAWKTSRFVYFLGNYGVGEKRFVSASDKKEGVKLFDYGVKAGKIAMDLDPSKVEGYYWYAVDLGSWGLAKGIIASASSAGDGMDALKAAKKLDPSYQWYGSSRILGRYYQELPGIFGGSDKKALALYEEATKKSPNSRVNWLYLGRYYLKDGDASKGLEICTKGLSLPNADGSLEETRYKRELNECVKDAKYLIFL